MRTTEILRVLLSTLRLILSLDWPGMSALTCIDGPHPSLQHAHVVCTAKAWSGLGWGAQVEAGPVVA